MKSTFEIIEETAKLFNRFASELPKYYMQEVFGKQDEALAEKCLQAPKYGVSAVYRLIASLKYDERKAIASYINRVNK